MIDLRNNPGGLLDQAISVSDAFLDKGEIVLMVQRVSRSRRSPRRAFPHPYTRPQMFLNRPGASAA